MWRKMTPPGRFLTLSEPKLGDASPWQDIGDKAAQKKTAKRLRESLPEGAPLARSTAASYVSSSDDDQSSSDSSSSSSNVSNKKRTIAVRRVSNDFSMERTAKRVRLEFNNLMTTSLPSFEDQFSQVSDDLELMAEEDLDLDSLFDESPEEMPPIDSLSGIDKMDKFQESWLSMTAPSSFNASQGGSYLLEIAGSIPSAATLTDGILFD